ncbi:MAG: hypothetical protein WCN81_17415, partial [Actinomycetes bacterium]
MIIAVVASYSAAYSTAGERGQLLSSLAANAGLKALLGPARSLNTVGGFTAWRSMSFLPLVAAAWGLIAATGALRGEEDAGRRATVIAGVVGRGRYTAATFVGLLWASMALLGVTAVATGGAALVDGGFGIGGALFLSIGLWAAAPVYMAVGALTSQVAPTRKLASGMAACVLGITWVMRVAADSDSSLDWLRWASPLGWIEELRPMAGQRLWPIALIAALTALLASSAVYMSARRDDGSSVLRLSTDRAPRPWLLGSAAGLALRERLGGLAGWSVGVSVAMFTYGALSKTVADIAKSATGIQKHVSQTMESPVSVATARGYLALLFLFLAIVVALHAVSHSNAAAEEEREGRAATVLGGAVSRRDWFLARVAVQLLGIAAVCSCAAVAAWLGAEATGAGVT